MAPDAVACALWIGSRFVAADPAINPAFGERRRVVTTYLALVHPAARA